MSIVERLQELTDVDFERDSAETESKHSSLHSLLTQFIENEARSCSMDFGCVTAEYVYRMWGGNVSIEDIKEGFKKLQKQGIPIVVK